MVKSLLRAGRAVGTFHNPALKIGSPQREHALLLSERSAQETTDFSVNVVGRGAANDSGLQPRRARTFCVRGAGCKPVSGVFCLEELLPRRLCSHFPSDA